MALAASQSGVGAVTLTDHAKHALRLHFAPDRGSRYWIRRAQDLGLDPREFETLDDLALLGPMDEQALRSLPLDDFVPAAVQRAGVRLIPSETGGATGAPKMVVFTPSEFEAGFVEPFVRAAHHVGFPRGGRWLFVGPTGPHIIGRAARACARRLGAGEPFTVDFDPRWHRRLLAGSLARRRHLDHIVEQALHVLRRAEITVLFITPSVLEALMNRMTPAQRGAIRGIHFGGQPLLPEALAAFRAAFPRAVTLGGYGNSLVGLCPEVPGGDHTGVCHHASPPRHVVRLLADPARSLTEEVAAGERGRVMFHRFDESFLILNMVERDSATRVGPSRDAASLGLDPWGLGDPAPAPAIGTKAVEGIY